MARAITLYAGGRIKNTPYMEAAALFLKRLTWWDVTVIECSDAQWNGLTRRPRECWVGLCERGHVLTSEQFSAKLARWMEQEQAVTFLIGSWDGLPSSVRQQCQHTMALSAMTWPHLLARVMLLEQLYRAQQRLGQHPYSLV